MSSFVVGTDHIDYFVSAVLVYAPHRLVDRTPTDLGRQLLAENVDTVVDRYIDLEDETVDVEVLAEWRDETDRYRAMIQGYTFREVDDVEPAQAAQVAACWQYQRTREGYDDFPATWVTADEVIAAALASVGPDRLSDPAGPRAIHNLRRDGLAWEWTRGASAN